MPLTKVKRPVVGVGLPKTGTATLGTCLEYMGWSVLGWDRFYAEAAMHGNIQLLLRPIARGMAARDLPWCKLYNEIERAIPESLFILTIRDQDLWLRSILTHFAPRNKETLGGAEYRESIFGAAYPQGNEDRYLAAYNQHNREVIEYFSSSDKLLVCCWEQGSGWIELCQFLGRPLVNIDFPHLNKKEQYMSGPKRLLSKMWNLAKKS